METGEDLRKGTRRQADQFINYSVPVLDLSVVRRIHGTGMCTDMSAGGLRMTTGYPLQRGHVLIFEDHVRNGIPASFAVVKWVYRIDGNTYHVGMKFA